MSSKTNRILLSGLGVCFLLIALTAVAQTPTPTPTPTSSAEWDDLAKGTKKAQAIRNVVRHFLGLNDADYNKDRKACINDRKGARECFTKWGDLKGLELKFPDDAKVTFLSGGDNAGKDGSLLLEFPSPEAANITAWDRLYKDYVESQYNGLRDADPDKAQQPRDWKRNGCPGDGLCLNDRAAAIRDVLQYLAKHQELKDKCLEDDGFSGFVKTDLFSRNLDAPGQITPPPDIKIIFLPPGQINAQATGSLVIQLPEHSEDTASDDERIQRKYTASQYKYWIKPLD